jgi:tRNA threonylcarbamoyladenosine biosynthesis protein TsaB
MMPKPNEEMIVKVLALDTSTPRGSVALLEGRDLAAELRLLSLETHSARLLGSVEYLLRISGWQLGDLHLVAAGIGPGSFTGIRIGVATAIGLAQVMSIPFAGISCLDAVAHLVTGLDGRIGVVMDAQRAQVYYAEYSREQEKIRRIAKPALRNPADLGKQLQRERIYLAGDGALRYADELKPHKSCWPKVIVSELFLAAALGKLALDRKQTWRSGEFLQAEPLYIRPPDALRPKVNLR